MFPNDLAPESQMPIWTPPVEQAAWTTPTELAEIPQPPTWNPWSPPPKTPRVWSLPQILALVLVVSLVTAFLTAGGTYFALNTNQNGGGARAVAALSQTPSSTNAPSASSAPVANNGPIVSLTQNQAIVQVFKAASPAVVTIDTTGTATTFRGSVPYSGSGSGFLINATGLILTNNHVISGSTTLSVTLADGRQFTGTIVSADATHDLALVQIKAAGLPYLTLADSSTIQIGQLVIAIGNPLGSFADSVTQGIVSGNNRDITVSDATGGSEALSGLIQTDAAINPGNSGGPLLDVNGQVIGVVTASSANAAAIGFAIPINQAKAMVTKAG
jgi:serine protease Do